MPTGYTAKIENGEITNGKDFIKLCLNNFGIMVHRREEGMTLEPQDFNKIYGNDLNRYQENIITHTNEKQSSIDKWVNHNDEYRESVINTLKQRIDELNAEYIREQTLYQKYDKIRNEILSWNCSDDYKAIKDFAIEQIDISRPSLKWYTNKIKEYNEYLLDIDKYVEDDYKACIEYYDRCIQLDKEDYEKTKKMIETKQKFYDNLINEINNIKTE